MSQYLVTGYLPDDFDPSDVTEEIIEGINALNREMDAAGVTKFAGGLSPVIKSLRKQPDGTVLITDGPYLETKEHIGGFAILETADLDEAVKWQHKASVVCCGSGEVREIFFGPGGLDALNQSKEGEDVRPLYLVALYRPDDFDPSDATEEIMENIHALNREMLAVGARKLACGLSAASSAKSLRSQPDGKVLVTDGPYIETKEHIGGFWILAATDQDEAVEWGRKAAIACRASGEVHQIFFRPDGSK